MCRASFIVLIGILLFACSDCQHHNIFQRLQEQTQTQSRVQATIDTAGINKIANGLLNLYDKFVGSNGAQFTLQLDVNSQNGQSRPEGSGNNPGFVPPGQQVRPGYGQIYGYQDHPGQQNHKYGQQNHPVFDNSGSYPGSPRPQRPHNQYGFGNQRPNIDPPPSPGYGPPYQSGYPPPPPPPPQPGAPPPPPPPYQGNPGSYGGPPPPNNYHGFGNQRPNVEPPPRPGFGPPHPPGFGHPDPHAGPPPPPEFLPPPDPGFPPPPPPQPEFPPPPPPPPPPSYQGGPEQLYYPNNQENHGNFGQGNPAVILGKEEDKNSNNDQHNTNLSQNVNHNNFGQGNPANILEENKDKDKEQISGYLDGGFPIILLNENEIRR